jgi:hypothetical protein
VVVLPAASVLVARWPSAWPGAALWRSTLRVSDVEGVIEETETLDSRWRLSSGSGWTQANA